MKENYYQKLCFCVAFVGLLSGCSVYKASSNEGVDVSDVEGCTS